MQIDSRSSKFEVTNTANVTAASITFPVPTITKPSGDGIVHLGDGGALAPNGLMIVPFGAGSSTNTFSMNVYGWRRTLGSNTKPPLWVAVELATFTCTLCTVPGIVSTDVADTQLFTGTIALVHGNANVSNEVVSPTGNVVAHVIVDAKGCELVEVRFGTGSSATSCNALIARM